MSTEEKFQRQANLYQVVTTHTSHTWASVLVKNLLEKIGTENTAHQTPYLDLEKMKARYNSAKKRLLLFDYDVSLFPRPHTCLLSNVKFPIGYIDSHCENSFHGYPFA